MSNLNRRVQLLGPSPHQTRVLLEHPASSDQVQRHAAITLTSSTDYFLRQLSSLDASHRADQQPVADRLLDVHRERRLIARTADGFLQ